MTAFNTISNIGKRVASELDSLLAKTLEQSSVSKNIGAFFMFADKSNYNTVNKIKGRKISELQGLKMSIVQESFRDRNLRIFEFKIIKPLKTYKNKIKLLFKYNNTSKY